MDNNLVELINGISEIDVKTFVSQTKSDFLVRTSTESVKYDFSWINMIEESLPYIDNIIRNPRRFMVPEEEVVIIEKTKKVTKDSIKHLAQHTSLIRDVEPDGTVKPSKLLNTYKEETIDLYENRFIYSLLKNLYVFMLNQSSFLPVASYSSRIKKVQYRAQTKIKKENIRMNLVLESTYKEESNEDISKIQERIKNINQIVSDFNSSAFMKNLVNISPVKSPIRRTNVILKDQNFRKALELWEFLEEYNLNDPTKKEKSEVEDSNSLIKNKYDLTYFINYDALERKIENTNKSLSEMYLTKIIDEMIKNNTNVSDIKKLITKEFNSAVKRKEKYNKEICDYFKLLREAQDKMISKAIKLI